MLASAAENRSVNKLYRAHTEILEEINLGMNSTLLHFSSYYRNVVPYIDNLVTM